MLYCPVRQVLLVCNALYFSKLHQQKALARHSLKFRMTFKLRRWLICQSVRQADVVMTPTQATLDDLRQFVEVKPQKALVNHYGVALLPSSLPQAPRLTPEPPAPGQRVVRLIYVSYYSEHKNLSTLLSAMALLNRDGAGKFLLRTTVDPADEGLAWMVTRKEDLALAHQPQVAPWVELLGLLPDGEVQQLYREGDVFVFPSICESFGHPMGEAMVHGLPIVASDTPVNREVCGDAAVYFSPFSAEGLAQQVKSLTEDPALMARLGAAGRERAATLFRWDRHVQRMLEGAGAPQEGTGDALR